MDDSDDLPMMDVDPITCTWSLPPSARPPPPSSPPPRVLLRRGGHHPLPHLLSGSRANGKFVTRRSTMNVWNYVVTAHKSTNITHSCVKNFTSPHELNLIIAMLDKRLRLEIEQELRLMQSLSWLVRLNVGTWLDSGATLGGNLCVWNRKTLILWKRETPY